ncbi:MAG: hypothetical protein JWP35_712 [Caulobacter sp.]|nr:hypothetical protein [Caulobacter sp.]
MPAAQIAVQAATALVAVYGAALATHNAILARRKDRRSLIIKMSTAMYTYGAELGPPMVSIDVVNDGHRSLVVDAPQLTVESDPSRVIVLLGADGIAAFPKRLEDGETASLRIAYSQVANALMKAGHPNHVRLRAICKDSAGRIYHSKPWAIDIQEWLRMGQNG